MCMAIGNNNAGESLPDKDSEKPHTQGFCTVGGVNIPEGHYGVVAGNCYYCGVGAQLIFQGPAPCPKEGTPPNLDYPSSG